MNKTAGKSHFNLMNIFMRLNFISLKRFSWKWTIIKMNNNFPERQEMISGLLKLFMIVPSG
jgi:hypothetical protein